MTDRPIIFSAPMVRALLDGRKTQTRRVLKPQPRTRWRFSYIAHGVGETLAVFETGEIENSGIRLPYAPGDRLWVRETWRVGLAYEDLSPSALSGEEVVDYVADNSTARWSIGRTRSPIHMPRWASRLTLLVTDVRVQRLQEISEEDARAEGLGWRDTGRPSDNDMLVGDPVPAFSRLWDRIHAAGSWKANPWVAAVSFTTERWEAPT